MIRRSSPRCSGGHSTRTYKWDLRWLFVIAITCLGLVSAAFAQAAEVTTNKSDYIPGETVFITGTGWQPGETVSLVLTETPLIHDPITLYATADASGNIANSEYAPEEHDVGQTMTLTATGMSSGLVATTTFTDANESANLDQVRNGPAGAPIDPPNWVNGNANATQAHFVEGYSIPYRMVFENLTLGSNTVVIEWDIKHSGEHAIDFITHYQRLEPHGQFLPAHSAETVNPLLGLSGTFGVPTTFPIPAPSSSGSPVGGEPTATFNALPGGERVMTMYNGTITSLGYVSEGNLNSAASSSSMSITFNATSATVVLAWGGHIGTQQTWGNDNSAVAVNGSPYHTRLISLNGSGGNQDRSLAAGAVLGCDVNGPAPVCSGTQNVYSADTNVGSPTYAWSFASNSTGATFVGATNGSSVTVDAGAGPGSYTVKVAITNQGAGVTCEKIVFVNGVPACALTGPDGPVCPSTSQQFCGPVGMASYAWTVTSGGTIVGPSNEQCVTVQAGATCNSSYTVSLTISDGEACPNTCDKTINVNDTTDPVLVGVPANDDLGCNPTLPSCAAVTATDNCDGALGAAVCVPGAVTGDDCNKSQTFTYSAVDACGNSASASTTYTWKVDTTDPVLVGVPANDDLGCNPTLPSCAAVTATDNCDGALGAAVCVPGAVTGDDCNKSQTFTYSAVDACGNSASASTTYTWKVDTTDPVLVGVPANDDLGCNPTLPSCAAVTATDNCDGALGAAVCVPGAVTGDDCNKSQTFTYSAVDACGNSASASTTYTWKVDTTDPVLVGVPANDDLGCNPTLPSCAAVTATDNCDGALGAAVCVPGAVTGDDCNKSQTFTYSAVDACGNSASASTTYTWKVDTTDPVLVGVPANDDLGCNPTLPSCAAVTATDNCDGALGAAVCVPGAVTGDDCNKSQTFTYSAVDACGNSASASTTYTWKVDTTDPVLVGVPANDDLGCNPTLPSCAAVTATDNCDGNLGAAVCVPGAITGDDCNKSQTFTYSAVDACGNSASASTTYTWKVDTTDPVLVGVPANDDLGCNPTLPSCAAVTATDNCDGALGAAVCVPGAITGDDCNKSQTFTYSAVDACGNSASASTTYTWKVDTTDPVLVGVPANDDLGCNPTLPSCAAVTATDNCDGALGAAVCVPGAITGDDCNKSQTFTYSAVDACGNSASASTTYTWKVDTTDPVLVGVPASGDLGCNPTLPSCAAVTATDNCDGSLGAATCVPGSIQNLSSCRKRQVFTYSATDACGNSASASTTFTWTEDREAPVLVGLPAGGDLGCNPVLPTCANVTATDNCDFSLSVRCSDGDIEDDGNCRKSQTFTYEVTDRCGNQERREVRYFWKEDTTAPVLAGVPQSGDLGCNPTLPSCGNVTATDNCDGDQPVNCSPGEITGEGCFKSQTFTWSAVDECGNSASSSATLTWKDDTTGPDLTCPPDKELQCGDPVTPGFAGTGTATDACGNATVDFNDQPTPPNCTGLPGISRTWTATDDCGNTTTCVQSIVFVDTTPPSITCPPDVTVECNTSTHPDVTGSPTSSDNCGGEILVDFDDAGLTGPEPGCAGEPIQRVWTVTDNCGNSATCIQIISFEDTQPPSITCPGDISVGECDNTVTFAASGEDDCDETPTIVCVPASGSVFDVGTTPVTCTATDDCGNRANCEFSVTVDPNPPCGITSSGPVCSNESGELCAPEGDYSYLWSNGEITRCVTVMPGSYTVTITDPKTGCSTVCSATLETEPCHENCPRTVGFWQAQCKLDTDPASRFSSIDFLAIVQCVDVKATIFDFNGNAVNKYCAVMNPPKTDQRIQAKRQFAAFLSNICAGELNLSPANGNQVSIDLSTPISCTGLSSTTLGALVAEVDAALVALNGQNLKTPAVKQAYSQIISCLDKINNGIIPDSFCPSGQVAMTYSGDAESYMTEETAETSDLEPGTEEEVAPGIELYRPSPNPFTSRTRIAYAVTGTGGNVEIGIFDLAGRRVRSLVNGFQAPGRYELQWNGESDNGSRANHGVYFIRSNVAGVVKSMSVVYVK